MKIDDDCEMFTVSFELIGMWQTPRVDSFTNAGRKRRLECKCVLFRVPGCMAAVWLAFLVVAASGVMGCTRDVSGSPTTSKAMLSVDVGTVLLDADEIDDVLNTSGSQVQDEGNAPDDTSDVSPPQCHGVVYIAGEIEYASTNFTAMRWRIERGTAKSNMRRRISPRCVGGS